MAPTAKRKKPGEDDSSNAVKPAPKPRAKKQKTSDADPTASIETPPPTPKPAAAARGRKPAVTKAAKVNGTHAHTNGAVAEVAEDDKAAVEHNGDAVTDGSGEPGALVNGRANGHEQIPLNAAESEVVGAEKPANSSLPNGISDTHAKDATPAAHSNAHNSRPATLQENTNGHVSSSSAVRNSTDTIRPSTERPPPAMDAGKKPSKVRPKDREMRDKLYQYCIKKKPIGEIFSVEELKKANVTTDDRELLDLCGGLAQHFLFSPMTLNRGLVYKTRSHAVARILAQSSDSHNVIYSLIENTAGAGIWLRPLETKSGLPQISVRRVLKELLSAKAIQEIKSADTSKKTYISIDVKPDEKHIGGGFIDDGKVDDGMIEALTFVTVNFLKEKAWHKSDIRVSDDANKDHSASRKHKSKTPAARPSKSSSKDQPVVSIDDASATPAVQSAAVKERKIYPPWTHRHHELIPQHPGYYNKYPTNDDIMVNANESGVLKDTSLNKKDTEQFMEMMWFDGYAERMRDYHGEVDMKEPRWRVMKQPWDRGDKAFGAGQSLLLGPVEPKDEYVLPGNGYSQVPCARCPVRAKCKPGGVVSPEDCKYLDEWLAF